MNIFNETSLYRYKLLTKAIDKTIVKSLSDNDRNLVIYHSLLEGDTDKYMLLKGYEFYTNIEEWCAAKRIVYDYNFAKWGMDNIHKTELIKSCISSSFIMNNDLSYIYKNIYCIWYPYTARKETYKQLLEIRPDLSYNIARACIVAGYDDLYFEINPNPEYSLYEEAKEKNNKNILNDILNKTKQNNNKMLHLLKDCHDFNSEIITLNNIEDKETTKVITKKQYNNIINEYRLNTKYIYIRTKIEISIADIGYNNIKYNYLFDYKYIINEILKEKINIIKNYLKNDNK